MRNKGTLVNIDNSDLVAYPNGRIKNNTGGGDGTPVNEIVYGDIHEAKDKLMRLYGIQHNDLPDNEVNGYQFIDALVALASKNDFTLNLTSSTGVLNVPLKLGKLKDNETFILKTNVNKTTETTIKGTLDNITKAVVFLGDFKANEYIRMISTPTSIVLIRLIDSFNLETAITELAFLKKANQTEENAGAIDTVATTPLVNKTAFEKRVNGTDSSTYLATPGPLGKNGLLSKEDKEIIDGIGASPVKNIGTAAGIDIASGSIGTSYAVTGDIVSATLVDKPFDASTIRIVLTNTMTDTNYLPKIFIESLSAVIGEDNNQGMPVFKIINPTTFDLSIQSFQATTQNLKLHFEVKKL